MSTHLKTRIDSEKQKLVQPSTKSNFSSSSSISNSSSSSSNNSSSSSSSSSSSYSSSSSNIKSGNLNHHVVHCPDFPNAYVKWMVRTLQPLNTCESEEFREMTHVKACTGGRNSALPERTAYPGDLCRRRWCWQTDFNKPTPLVANQCFSIPTPRHRRKKGACYTCYISSYGEVVLNCWKDDNSREEPTVAGHGWCSYIFERSYGSCRYIS